MPRHPPYTLKSLATFIDHRQSQTSKLSVVSCSISRRENKNLSSRSTSQPFSWPLVIHPTCSAAGGINSTATSSSGRAGTRVKLKIPNLNSQTCKDLRASGQRLEIQLHPIANGPMISPKRCPTTPTRACKSEISFEISNPNSLQTEKPVAFNHHLCCTPGVGTSGYSNG
jgi:hypothetical protein